MSPPTSCSPKLLRRSHACYPSLASSSPHSSAPPPWARSPASSSAPLLTTRLAPLSNTKVLPGLPRAFGTSPTLLRALNVRNRSCAQRWGQSLGLYRKCNVVTIPDPINPHLLKPDSMPYSVSVCVQGARAAAYRAGDGAARRCLPAGLRPLQGSGLQ